MVGAPLNIPPLRTVAYLRERLSFLENSLNMTQIRNTCYLLQLGEMLKYINNIYVINRGQYYIYLYNFLRIEADCCEGLLYSFKVKQEGCLPNKKISLEDLINYAKSIHEPSVLLREDTKKGLEQLLFFRNNLHPDKQKHLHINLIKHLVEPQHHNLTNVPAMLVNDLNRYFRSK